MRVKNKDIYFSAVWVLYCFTILSSISYEVIFLVEKLIMEVTDKFAKSRAMCAMHAYVPKACQHFIFMCQRAKDVPFFKLVCQHAKSMTFHFYVPNMLKTYHFSNWRAKRHANFSTILQKKKYFNYGQHLQISRILGQF